MTRQAKTPKQRAEETLGVAQRRVAKLERTVRSLERDLTAARAELDEAKARRDYAAADPALKTPEKNQPSTSPSTPGGTTA